MCEISESWNRVLLALVSGPAYSVLKARKLKANAIPTGTFTESEKWEKKREEDMEEGGGGYGRGRGKDENYSEYFTIQPLLY